MCECDAEGVRLKEPVATLSSPLEKAAHQHAFYCLPILSPHFHSTNICFPVGCRFPFGQLIGTWLQRQPVSWLGNLSSFLSLSSTSCCFLAIIRTKDHTSNKTEVTFAGAVTCCWMSCSWAANQLSSLLAMHFSPEKVCLVLLFNKSRWVHVCKFDSETWARTVMWVNVFRVWAVWSCCLVHCSSRKLKTEFFNILTREVVSQKVIFF